MPYGLGGNHRSGISLAMCHRHEWFIHVWAEGRWVPHLHPYGVLPYVRWNVWIDAERSGGCITEVNQAEPGRRQGSFQSLAWSAEWVLQFVFCCYFCSYFMYILLVSFHECFHRRSFQPVSCIIIGKMKCLQTTIREHRWHSFTICDIVCASQHSHLSEDAMLHLW